MDGPGQGNEQNREPLPPLPPRPPRRPRTAYVFYIQQKYQDVLNEGDLQDPKDAVRRLAERWREMTGHEKEPFVKLSQEDALRYKTEKEEWLRIYARHPPKRRHRQRDRDAPRRTKNAFIYFEQYVWNQVRDSHPKMSQRAIVREIGFRWREMTPEQKSVYFEKSRKDKERYRKEKMEFVKRKKEMSMIERVERVQLRLDAERRRLMDGEPVWEMEAPDVEVRNLVPAAQAVQGHGGVDAP